MIALSVRPNNIIPIYVLACIVGILGFLLLPVGLELGCEITRNAETSSAMLWMSGNLFTLIFVLGMQWFFLVAYRPNLPSVADALRDDQPPHSMRRTLIFLASFVSVVSLTIIKFTGHQKRREVDMEKNREIQDAIHL